MPNEKNKIIIELEKAIIERGGKCNDDDFHKLVNDYDTIKKIKLSEDKQKMDSIYKGIEVGIKVAFFTFSVILGVKEISGKWFPMDFFTKAAVNEGLPKIK